MATSDRGGDPARAGALVDALLGGTLSRELTAAQRAARAWYAANGDRERAHTTGVWLKDPPRGHADPLMVVRVDSGLLASELGANKDLYLARLAFQGVRVCDIRFQVGGRRTARADGAKPHGAAKTRPPLAELSPAARERVERATSGLPDGLRQSVSRAMCASLRREKGRYTQEG